MAQFLLSARHGLVEKSEQNVSGSVTSNIRVIRLPLKKTIQR